MPVTRNDVEHIAKLARLNFSEEEKEKLTRELNEILKYMEKLDELDTTNVEPLSNVSELFPPGVGMMRDDNVKPSLPRDEALMNAPDKTEKFFKVPKVIGGQGEAKD